MASKRLALCIGGVIAAAAHAQHEPHGGAASGAPDAAPPAWTGQPLLLPAAARGGREGALLRPSWIGADRVTVFAPGGDAPRSVELPVSGGAVRIAPLAPGRGNYHWVQARQEDGDAVRVASTAWYFSAPGDAPTRLLAAVKSELEIVPTPLPREHGRYREGEQWDFSVRWQGAPLAQQPVTMETANGSRTRAVTDARGVARFVFPRDFAPDPQAGGGDGRRRADFVLATTYRADGRSYLTAFNHSYAPAPQRGRSLAWGAAFGVLGMLAATPLLRRKESRHD